WNPPRGALKWDDAVRIDWGTILLFGGVDPIIDSRICDAFAEIPKIKGEFDFVFIDAWKSDYLEFFHLVKERIKPGGVIAAHNVSNARGEMADFLQAIQSDSSFTTVIDKSSYAGVSLSFK
ncbi:MAG: hypothetical protein P8078_09320, partial [bacterium]